MWCTMLRVPWSVWISLVLIAVLLVGPLPVQAQPAPIKAGSGTLVYHQLTAFPEGSGSVGFPVLSADGTTGVFSDAPGTGEAATPNRIFTIDLATRAITEVDAYRSLCFCGSMVDISNDGATVVSSDSVQLRIAGRPDSLVTLASNELTALALTGNGETVYFLVRRDTGTADGATPLARGVWAIDADGTNLRQVVGADDVATAVGVPVEQTGCCVHADGHPLAVSESGDQIVFGAYAGDGEHVFTVDGDGGNLRVGRETVQNVMRVAISGDGATVAWDVLPLGASANELAVVPFGGGTPQVFAVPPATEYREAIQLSADGGQLLVSPNGLLIDTATGDARLLAVSITDVGGTHEAVLTDGLARATMDAQGERFLYAMRTVRCADCANRSEQLATLDLDPGSHGEAPEISGGTIEPAEIGLEQASETTITVTVDASNTVLGVGFTALLDEAMVDVNVGQGRVLLDDGQDGDARANDGVYTATGIVHAWVVARDPDVGPRTVRIAAEVEDDTGLRHATAVDIGILTVTGD
jgi:hypothetical protein